MLKTNISSTPQGTHQNLNLGVSLQVFHSKLKALPFMKSYPHSSSSSTSHAVSILNTIHHSRMTICLPVSLDLDLLIIDFMLIKHLCISWVLRLQFLKVL